MTFQDKLIALMREHDFSLSDLSRETGISKSTIARWTRGALGVKGTYLPKIPELKELARVFKVTVDILIHDEISLRGPREARSLTPKQAQLLDLADRIGVDLAIDRVLMAPRAEPLIPPDSRGRPPTPTGEGARGDKGAPKGAGSNN